MTKESVSPDNLRYLPEKNQKREIRGPLLEDLMLDIAERLDKLENQIQKNINQLQNDIEKKEPKDLKEREAFQREIDNLKSDFQSQIQKITSSLPKQLSKKKKEPFSFLRFLKKFIPTFGIFGTDNSTSEFQKIWNEEIDPFGRDPAFEDKLKPFLGFLYHKFWRTSIYGLENIPSKGRALLVSNHSGALPYDGSMLRFAVTMDHPAGRDVRFLVEDFVYYLPFIGTYMYRVGGVRASRDNAERLLNTDHLVAVFPEGVKGIGKYYSQRYHLQRFGRGGFIKLAIETNSPIIPVAIIGAEEIHPIIYKSSLLAKPLGIPYVPITPTLPLLGPLGLIPLPSKWSIYFGKPIDLSKYGKKVLEDELQIHKLSEMVRQEIQSMITEALKKRRSVWWG